MQSSLSSLRSAVAGTSGSGAGTSATAGAESNAVKGAIAADELSWDNEMASIAAGNAGDALPNSGSGSARADPWGEQTRRGVGTAEGDDLAVASGSVTGDITGTVRWYAALCVGEDTG